MMNDFWRYMLNGAPENLSPYEQRALGNKLAQAINAAEYSIESMLEPGTLNHNLNPGWKGNFSKSDREASMNRKTVMSPTGEVTLVSESLPNEDVSATERTEDKGHS